MFAGPNGAGKSTIKGLLSPRMLGAYINPDEMELALRSPTGLRLSEFGIQTDTSELRAFLAESKLLHSARLLGDARAAVVAAGSIRFDGVSVGSYHASVVADFIRRKLLAAGRSFTFETVMSSPDKVELLQEAKARGFRTYLYYVCTEDPLINVARVQLRVSQGGHDVPAGKIVARYRRSLDLLMDAIRLTNRAYIFDNSEPGKSSLWIAEITDGHLLELKSSSLPQWFQSAVIDKIAK